MAGGEEELEVFRRQWREEVARRDAAAAQQASQSASQKPSQLTIQTVAGLNVARKKKQVGPPPSSHFEGHTQHDDSEFEPRTFHDLEDKETNLKLGSEATRGESRTTEPESALEYYEKAVEEEDAGKLGKSVASYRKAFKLDPRVHHVYKDKHFSQPSSAPKPAPVPQTKSGEATSAPEASIVKAAPSTITELIEEFSQLSIPPAPAETNLSDPPPCPMAEVPEEILVAIFQYAATFDAALTSKLSQVCKRFAYIIMTENSIWKPVVLGEKFGIKAMHYRYPCDLRGFPLTHPNPTISMASEMMQLDRPDVLDLTPSVYPSYRNQFRHRPRIRFNGCYISTVNYQRDGGASQSRFTWVSPIHIVTYYRYLRFFRDGSVISLLTTSEPADVVHHLIKDNIHDRHAGGLPTYVMKDALHGRWRLSGPASSLPGEEASFDGQPLPTKGPGEYAKEPRTDWSILGDDVEPEGEVHVETEGVIPKYMWKMHFTLANAGRKDGLRNNKLNWKGFWSYNRLTDDWGEFTLKNDRPYYFSRVKSYGLGYES